MNHHSHFCVLVRAPEFGNQDNLKAALTKVCLALSLTPVRWLFVPWEKTGALTGVVIVGESHIVAQEYPEDWTIEFDAAFRTERPEKDLRRFQQALQEHYGEDTQIKARVFAPESHEPTATT